MRRGTKGGGGEMGAQQAAITYATAAAAVQDNSLTQPSD